MELHNKNEIKKKDQPKQSLTHTINQKKKIQVFTNRMACKMIIRTVGPGFDHYFHLKIVECDDFCNVFRCSSHTSYRQHISSTVMTKKTVKL